MIPVTRCLKLPPAAQPEPLLGTHKENWAEAGERTAKALIKRFSTQPEPAKDEWRVQSDESAYELEKGWYATPISQNQNIVAIAVSHESTDEAEARANRIVDSHLKLADAERERDEARIEAQKWLETLRSFGRLRLNHMIKFMGLIKENESLRAKLEELQKETKSPY